MVSRTEVLTTPYRHPPDRRATRWVIRATLLALGPFVESVARADRLRRLDGPFVAILNHSQPMEAFLVPALLAWLRGGRVIRFLADWNYMLLPPVYALYKSARIIPVTSKQARPRFLNALKTVVAPPPTGFDEARRCLERSRPVGAFVEGTTNPHPNRLLRGQRGAARLSKDAGVPVLPIGLRFPHHDAPDQPIDTTERLSIHVGTPLAPPAQGGLDHWHATLMQALATQSRTTWARSHPRRPSAMG